MAERRPNIRLRAAYKVRGKILSTIPSGVRRTFVATTRDIAVGGMQVVSRKQLPLGATVELTIECSRPYEAFDHIGTVVWVRKDTDNKRFVSGIRFTAVPISALTQWRKTLERRALQN